MKDSPIMLTRSDDMKGCPLLSVVNLDASSRPMYDSATNGSSWYAETLIEDLFVDIWANETGRLVSPIATIKRLATIKRFDIVILPFTKFLNSAARRQIFARSFRGVSFERRLSPCLNRIENSTEISWMG
jgi:hypothetical protein